MKQPVPCCRPLNTGNLTADEIMRFAALFRVLGEPARLQLLNSIAAQPQQEVRACELVETLGLSQPTVSHHLKVMYEAGLLSKERRGTLIYYRIVPQSLDALRSALADDQARNQSREQSPTIVISPDISGHQSSLSASNALAS